MNRTTHPQSSQVIDDLNQFSFSKENPLRILLLEDLDSDAELESYYIGEINLAYSIKHVTNKLDFFDQLEKLKPHIIVSDFQLPQFTGKEALIYTRERCNYLPFIICTGRINEETAVECIKLGADDYVLKDDLSRLPSAILNALEFKRNVIQKDILTEELIRREENLRAITENSPSNIFTIDNNGVILFTNNAVGGTAKVGESIFDYTSEINHAVLREKIDQCFDKKENVEFELKGTDIPPNTDWYSCKMGPIIRDGEVSKLVFIPHKITELIRAHGRLDSLNSRLNLLNNHLESVRDEEKKKIAMEIHDQLGQELTGTKLGLYWLKQNLKESSTEVNQKIDDLLDLSTQVIKTVRRIAHELRPVVLDDIGLIAALEWHINNYNKSGRNTQCSLQLKLDDEEFGKDISTTLYRIVQESLTNVDKHAKASEVKVILTKNKNLIDLCIQDNGVGLDPDKALNSSSMGIFGMQERIRKWKGTLDLKSNDEGTFINVKINLEND